MGLRNKRRELLGVVGAIGVAICVAGFVGGLLSPGVTVSLAFAVWAIGATLVAVFTD